jgi:hypothetical protein
MAPSHFNVYIDEAGDPGFTFKDGNLLNKNGESSEWLVLSAVLQPLESNFRLNEVCQEATAELTKSCTSHNSAKRFSKGLHFQAMKHEERVVWSKIVGSRGFVSATTILNKRRVDAEDREWFLPPTGRNRSMTVYLYALRILLRDVCRLARHLSPESKPTLQLIFDKRGGLDYGEIKRELLEMKERPSAHFTLDVRSQDDNKVVGKLRGALLPVPDWGMISDGNTIAGGRSEYPGLQVADCMASSVHQMLGGNEFRIPEHSYAAGIFANSLYLVSAGSHEDITSDLSAALRLHVAANQAVSKLFLK